jgi:Flp pilus assembly protein TadG
MLRHRLGAARAGEEGNAIVEFLFLAILLMVPLVYLVLVVFRLQAAAYALAGATREAGRAFITAPSSDVARQRAASAAFVAMRDLDVPFSADELDIACRPSCRLAPGTTVTVRIATSVALPLLPDVLGGKRLRIGVDGSHTEYVDRFRQAR